MEKQKKILAVYQNVEDVGKNIKGTKKRYTWVIEIDGKMYTFILDTSVISGKIKLTCNNQIVAAAEGQIVGGFQHSMVLDDCQVLILSTSDSFELRINNRAFSHMLGQERTQKEFVRGSQAFEDFVLDQTKMNANVASNGLKKTIKLKIGSMKTSSLKQSYKSMQSDNWSQMMSGEQNSFPNYFEQQSSGTTQQVDYSKVSMKKKSTAEDLSQKETQNLLEQQTTQVIEITPEQFCTMQQLFRTQVPIQATNNSSKTEQTESMLPPGINMTDFSTMQMLFQTQCGVTANTEGSSQGTTSNSTTQQVPQQITINLQDFNTMQMMFNTMNLGSLAQTQLQTPTTQTSASTLLDTLSLGESTSKPTETTTPTPSFNMNDFSTMQMMFATNNASIMKPQTMNTQGMAQTPVIKTQTATENCSQTQAQQPNALDFVTMAGLFKTMNWSQSETTIQQTTSTPSTSFDDLLKGVGLSNTSNNANTNINMLDFSTMQNLFKTNSGIPTQSQKPTTGQLKENSIPFMF